MNTNNNNTNINALIKILLLGDTNVGKSSLINTYQGDIFREDILYTLFTENFTKKVIFEDKGYTIKIFDMPGSERFRNQIRANLRLTTIIILVFDMTSKKSFLELDKILQAIQEDSNLNKYSYILIGNKADLIDKWEIKEKEGEKFAEIMNAKFFLSSAKCEPEKFKVFLDEYIEEYIKLHTEELEINRQQRAINLNRNERRRRNNCI